MPASVLSIPLIVDWVDSYKVTTFTSTATVLIVA
jgi:hypothetical protein